MHPFFRVIKLSLANKWTIAALVLNSLLIGVLWGGSISAVYPFVEVVFSGRTIETWLDDEVRTTRETIGQLDQETSELRRRMETEGPSAALRMELGRKLARRDAEAKALGSYEMLRPWIVGHVPKTPFGTLVMIMGALIAATAIKGACLIVNTVLVARVANRTGTVLRRMFYRSALHMDQLVIDRQGATSMMTMLVHNLGLVTAGLKSLYGTSLREPIKMFACLAVAAFISWQLLLLAIVVVPFGGLAIHYLSKRMKLAALREMDGIGGILRAISETLSGLRIVRIYNRERTEIARFKKSANALYRCSMRLALFDSLVRPTTELVGILCLVVAILAGGYLVLNDTTHLFGIRMSERPLSIGSVFVFFAMLAGASDPARKMADIYNNLVRASVASRSLYSFFEKPPKVCSPDQPTRVPLHSKELVLNQVNFAYGPRQIVLKHLCLKIPFGQTVAIVGPNGCGKTTLVNLIARFYDPQWGGVWLDGVNLKQVNPRQVRRQIALVTQDPVLFRGTVLDNIRYGNRNASPEEVLAAAKLAHVADFIDDLPDGYQTQVGDAGNQLSGGQRQRIALARAIVADPRIMILDEATSQIDRETEKLLHESLRTFLKQRTTILISHRLSTLTWADRILVLNEGQIVSDLPYDEYANKIATHYSPLKAG